MELNLTSNNLIGPWEPSNKIIIQKTSLNNLKKRIKPGKINLKNNKFYRTDTKNKLIPKVKTNILTKGNSNLKINYTNISLNNFFNKTIDTKKKLKYNYKPNLFKSFIKHDSSKKSINDSKYKLVNFNPDFTNSNSFSNKKNNLKKYYKLQNYLNLKSKILKRKYDNIKVNSDKGKVLLNRYFKYNKILYNKFKLYNINNYNLLGNNN